MVFVASALAYFYEDEIKSVVVTNINKNLNTPVSVKQINFSFIRKFPFATLEFVDVKAQGRLYSETKKDFVVADKIFLMFNLMDIFDKNIALKKIELKNATINIYINKNGSNNYEVWKSDTTNTTSTFNLDLQDVIFNKVKINYISIPKQQDYAAYISQGNLNGRFASESFELKSKADLLFYHFKVDGVNLLSNKTAKVAFGLQVNNKLQAYTFRDATFTIADLILKTEGTITTLNQSKVDLKIHADNANLKALASLIPQQYLKDVDQYNYSGSVNFDASINGLVSSSRSPLIDIKFGATNATLSPRNSDYKITALHFKGHYINRKSTKQPVSYISLTELRGNLEGQAFKGSLQVEDFAHPFVNFTAQSKVRLASLSHFYKPDTIAQMDGDFLVNASFSGRADDKKSYTSSGTIEMQNVNFRLKRKDVNFNNFNGHFALDGNQLTVKDFRGQADGSDFQLNGRFNNIFSYLMLDNQILLCDADLASRNIDLNELLEDKSVSTQGDTAYKIDFSDQLNLKLRLNIGIISFRKFQAWQMRGAIVLADKVLSTDNIAFKAVEGSIVLQGSINTSRRDSMLISYNADVKKLNISQLFYEMGNFGQTILTDQNLKGSVTANLQFASVWSKNLHCNLDKVYAKADVTIENGELNNFAPMLALARYLKGADLKNIKFSTLHNIIEIRRQQIIIPSMQIKCSAFDLTASGTHSFENEVDYHLAFLLSQITGKKVKEQNTEFGTIEDDGLGRSKLFISMKGPVANPKIAFDRKATEDKIEADIKLEKKNLKNILNNEFGWFKKDSSITTQPTKKKVKEELQLDTEE